ncbi:MAG TPA: universal stress protein [Terriglobia bacterium]|nr:universal stress protein [Terriglobia bacterium]
MMLNIKRILYPTDFSEASARAYAYAESLARHYSAKLHVIHVAQAPTFPYSEYPSVRVMDGVLRDLRGYAEKQLAGFMNGRLSHAADHGIELECTALEGSITAQILQFAEKNGVDLIVMGTHGLEGADRQTLGSVTEKVLRKASCPVLAIRKPEHSFVTPGSSADSVGLRKILYCTDFSNDSNRASDYAFSLAMEYGAEITLLNVLEDLPGSSDAQSAIAEVKDRLRAIIPPEAAACCSIPIKVRIGRPYQEIIQLALEDQTDLVVLGVHGRNIVDLALFGSTTYRVVQRGSCPVLSVHI